MLQSLKEAGTVFDEPEQGERVGKDSENLQEPGDRASQVTQCSSGFEKSRFIVRSKAAMNTKYRLTAKVDQGEITSLAPW